MTLNATDRDGRLRALLEKEGRRDSLGYFALRGDKSVQFSPTGKAAIAYRVVSGVALAGGDPIGDHEAWPGAIKKYLAECALHAWTPAVMGCSELGAQVWVREGRCAPWSWETRRSSTPAPSASPGAPCATYGRWSAAWSGTATAAGYAGYVTCRRRRSGSCARPQPPGAATPPSADSPWRSAGSATPTTATAWWSPRTSPTRRAATGYGRCCTSSPGARTASPRHHAPRPHRRPRPERTAHRRRAAAAPPVACTGSRSTSPSSGPPWHAGTAGRRAGAADLARAAAVPLPLVPDRVAVPLQRQVPTGVGAAVRGLPTARDLPRVMWACMRAEAFVVLPRRPSGCASSRAAGPGGAATVAWRRPPRGLSFGVDPGPRRTGETAPRGRTAPTAADPAPTGHNRLPRSPRSAPRRTGAW
ncbi:phosphatidylglycerol lysyltransferase domain-containing protein [Streptomyces sp. M19]